jgi:hypothetical protein
MGVLQSTRLALVLLAGARISMAAKGTPSENAQAERFLRFLKQSALAGLPRDGERDLA